MNGKVVYLFDCRCRIELSPRGYQVFSRACIISDNAPEDFVSPSSKVGRMIASMAEQNVRAGTAQVVSLS